MTNYNQGSRISYSRNNGIEKYLSNNTNNSINRNSAENADGIDTLVEDIPKSIDENNTRIALSKNYYTEHNYCSNPKINKFLDDILFVKKSLGKDEKIIDIYKVRTMKKGKDHMFKYLADRYGQDDKGNILYDPRITKAGKLMRKIWVDELPQLYNLLKGDIKIVGVRPMSEHHWEKYPFKEKALKQKPGLLGVNYAAPKGAASKQVNLFVEKYLEEYQKNPLITDIKYFGKIWHNIIFKGVRSS